MELLKELYNISSPSHKEKKMIKFITAKLKEMGVSYRIDKVGNIFATKGDSQTYPCVVSHTDEVHRRSKTGYEVVSIRDEIIFGYSSTMRDFCGIGADDKNGIWICLKCLEEFDELKCAFFVGEEVGCTGSRYADMSFFEDCRFVLQCDRKGNSDLITSISGTDLCSAEFLDAVSPKDYRYSTTHGMMTDVMTLKERGLAISCVNISCGYYNPHTANEMTKVDDLYKCQDFVRHIIMNCTEVYTHTYTARKRMSVDSYMSRYFSAQEDWGMQYRVLDTGTPYQQQRRAMRRKMEVLLLNEEYLSLDEVISRFGKEYEMLQRIDYEQAYVNIMSEISLNNQM